MTIWMTAPYVARFIVVLCGNRVFLVPRHRGIILTVPVLGSSRYFSGTAKPQIPRFCMPHGTSSRQPKMQHCGHDAPSERLRLKLYQLRVVSLRKKTIYIYIDSIWTRREDINGHFYYSYTLLRSPTYLVNLLTYWTRLLAKMQKQTDK